MEKIPLFHLSLAGSASDQNGKRVEVESVPITNGREKIPIEGAKQDQFFTKIELKP
jgi:hypothetical protein